MPTLTEEQIQQILDVAGPRADQIRRILGEDLDSEPEKAEEKKEEESSDEESDSEE